MAGEAGSPEPSCKIALLDYGMGNLRSVEKALERAGASVVRTSDPAEVQGCDGIVLPGVGAFPRAMNRITELGLFDRILFEAATGKPILGICLGMQLLLDGSEELGGAEGLGLIPGEVSALRAGELKVPHIGWSAVRWEQESRLGEGLAEDEPFYFVHSFVARPPRVDVTGSAEYGERFACLIEHENVFGAQFHPEKSSAAGLRMLRNFAALCSGAPV